MPRTLKSLMNNAGWLAGWLVGWEGNRDFSGKTMFLLGRPCYTYSVSRKLLALKKLSDLNVTLLTFVGKLA